MSNISSFKIDTSNLPLFSWFSTLKNLKLRFVWNNFLNKYSQKVPKVCWLLRPSWLQAHCVSVWLFGLENLTAEPRIFSRRQAVSSSCRTQPNPNKIPKVLEKRNLFISNPKSQNPRFFVEFNVRLLPAQRDHGSEKLPSHLGKSSEKKIVHKVLFFWQGYYTEDYRYV